MTDLETIRVAGNVVSELSEKIPTHIVALNELMKNSYDEFAKNVEITLDEDKKQLIVADDGKGLDRDDIRKLFHISKSEKKYGEIRENKELNIKRRTQGSKGLGFLSVFKFGKNVTWFTNKNDVGLKFSANLDEILNKEDVTEYKVLIDIDNKINKGTKIVIDLDDYSYKYLSDYFSQESNAAKVVDAFYSDNFNISLITNIIREGSNKIDLLNYYNDDKLFDVSYSSDTGVIEFFENSKLIKSIDFHIDEEWYDLSLNISIYQLKPYGKRNIHGLFLRPKDDAITPLLYVNENIFYNFDLFDPNEMRSTKSSKSLHQMIGYIRINTNNKGIEFNSDRTNFVQNEYTEKIKQTLLRLNKEIQIEGSKVKNKKKEKGEEKEGEPNNKDEVCKAEIRLKKGNLIFSVPYHEQLDLREQITSAIGSDGKAIGLDKIQIHVNGRKVDVHIIESQYEPCRKLVEYLYDDPITGKTSAALELEYRKPISDLSSDDKNFPLIRVYGDKNYVFRNDDVRSLIAQIVRLDQEKQNQYNHLIACSLRPIFELSIADLKSKNKFPSLTKGINLVDDVETIMGLIDEEILRKISSGTSYGFKDLKNLHNKEEFKKVAIASNLGAHKSMVHLTRKDIENIAAKAGHFAFLVNEIAYNIQI